MTASTALTLPAPRPRRRLTVLGETLAICVVPVAAIEALLPGWAHKTTTVVAATWALSGAAIVLSLAWRRLRWPAIALALAVVAVAQLVYAALGWNAYRQPFMGHVVGAVVSAGVASLLTVVAGVWTLIARSSLGPSRLAIWGSLVSVVAMTALLLGPGEAILNPPLTLRQVVVWSVALAGDDQPGRRLWQLRGEGLLRAEASTTDAGQTVLSVRLETPVTPAQSLALVRERLEWEPGTTYELRLRARSPLARKLGLVIGTAGAKEPWHEESTQLGPDWSEIAAKLTIPTPPTGDEPTDEKQASAETSTEPSGFLSLVLAGPPGTIDFDRLVVRRLPPRDPTEFSDEAWELETAEGQRVRLVHPPGEPGRLRVAIEVADEGEPSAIRLRQTGLKLSAGQRYAVQFLARADALRSLTAAMVDANTGEPLSQRQTFDLSDTATPCRWQFIATADVADGGLELDLGGSSTSVELEAFRLAAVAREHPTQIVRDDFRLELAEGSQADWSPLEASATGVRVEIPAAVPGPCENIRLVQEGLELAAGGRYRLTFRARAPQPRRLVGGLYQHGERQPRLTANLAELTDDWQTHEMDFVATDTGVGTLAFELGGQAIDCELDQIQLEPLTKASPTELLPDAWQLAQAPGAQARLEPVDDPAGAQRITIDELPGPESWNVRLLQSWLAIRSGERYRLQFRARADAARKVEAHLLSRKSGVFLGLSGSADVTPEWTEHSLSFLAGADEPDATLEFNLGGADGWIELDQVRLLHRQKEWPTQLEQDGWQLNLAEGTAGQIEWRGESADVLRVELQRQPQTEAWQMGLVQRGLPLAAGVRYRLSLRARADAPRTLPLLMLSKGAPRPAMEARVELDTEWRSTVIHFVPETDQPQAALIFNLGGADAAVELAEIELRENPKSSPTELPVDDWRLSVHPDLRARLERTPDAPERLRIAIEPFGAESPQPWNISLGQTGVGLEAGRYYEVRFRAKADRPRSGSFAIVAADSGDFLGLYQDLKLTDRWKQIRLPFRAAAGTPSGRAFFNLGQEAVSVDLESIELVPVEASRGALTSPQESEAPLAEPTALGLGRLPLGQWKLRVRTARKIQARASNPANDPNAVRIDLVNGARGSAPDAHLSWSKVPLHAGRTYTATFRVRADVPRTIVISMSECEPPFEPLGLQKVIPVTTHWRTIVQQFTAEKSTRVGSFGIDLAGHEASVELADFVWTPRSPYSTQVSLIISNLVVALIVAFLARTERWAALSARVDDEPEPPRPAAPAHAQEIRYGEGETQARLRPPRP